MLAACLITPHFAQAARSIDLPTQPLAFEVNRGQTDPSVAFLARGQGYILYLRPTEAVLVLKSRAAGGRHRLKVLRMGMVGASPDAPLNGLSALPGRRNYYIGSDPSRWRTGIPTYGQVEERGVYPGVDLIYHGQRGVLEYDFVIAPGADPDAVRLTFKGADTTAIDERGDLVLGVGGDRVVHHAPVAYQTIDGRRVAVDAHYARAGATVTFRLSHYDKTRPLVIDPALNYASYLGGSLNDLAYGVAADSSGNAYITGATQSADFPVTDSSFLHGSHGTNDVFITKINSKGSIVYSTYLGSDGSIAPAGGEKGDAIAVDAQDNAYITGTTAGNATIPFPTTSITYKVCPTSNSDLFVSILDNSGSLFYSTCIGGGQSEEGMGIAVDNAHDVYVAGYTTSVAASPFLDPATMNGYQTTTKNVFNGYQYDAVFFKLRPLDPTTNSSKLLYATYLAGTQLERALGVAIDANDVAYVTGWTNSSDFPTTSGAFQTQLAGGQDAFLAKIDPAESGAPSLKYATYLGGSGDDAGNGIAVIAPDFVYIAGGASSTGNNFPNTNGTSFGGQSDAFVAFFKLNQTPALSYATLLGGSGNDVANAIAVDPNGRAYITGATLAPTSTPNTNDFPIIPVSGLPANYSGGTYLGDAFVSSLDSFGNLIYSAYLGGSTAGGTTGDDEGMDIALDSSNTAYIVGGTTSTDFPLKNAQQPTLAGGQDAFIAKVGLAADLSVSISAGVPTTFQPFTYTVTVTNYGPDEATGVTLKLKFSSNGLASPNDTNGTCTYDSTQLILTCPIGNLPAGGAPNTVEITGTFTAAQTLTVSTSVSANETDPNLANNTAPDINSTAGQSSTGGGSSTTVGSGTNGKGGGAAGPFMILGLLAVILLRGAAAANARRRGRDRPR